MRRTYIEIADNSHANGLFWGKQIKSSDKDNKTKDFFMFQKGMAKAYMKAIYYYALAGKIGQANSKVNVLRNYLKEIKTGIDNQQTKLAYEVSEIDWKILRERQIENYEELYQDFLAIFNQPRKNEPCDDEL